jgi:hypothetical protein
MGDGLVEGRRNGKEPAGSEVRLLPARYGDLIGQLACAE